MTGEMAGTSTSMKIFDFDQTEPKNFPGCLEDQSTSPVYRYNDNVKGLLRNALQEERAIRALDTSTQHRQLDYCFHNAEVGWHGPPAAELCRRGPIGPDHRLRGTTRFAPVPEPDRRGDKRAAVK